MKKHTSILLPIIASLLLLSGCETVPVVAPLNTSTTIPVAYDKAWAAVVAEVGMSYPVAAVEKDSGLITTDFVIAASGLGTQKRFSLFIQKPQGPLFAVWDQLRMKLNVMVLPVDDTSTQVSIRAHYEAYEKNVTQGWVVCQTNGIVEDGILRSVRQTLGLPVNAAAPLGQ